MSRALDSGAHGIIFPDIRTREQAQLAAAATVTRRRARGPGAARDTRRVTWEGVRSSKALQQEDVSARGVYSDQYVDRSNRNIHTTILVENPEGVRNLPDCSRFRHRRVLVRLGGIIRSRRVPHLERCVEAATSVYEECCAAGVGMCLALDQAEAAASRPRLLLPGRAGHADPGRSPANGGRRRPGGASMRLERKPSAPEPTYRLPKKRKAL